jgi:hypothetical protein
MKIHLATAASALALAFAGAAPALASDQAVMAAATALPLSTTDGSDDAAGVIVLAATEAAPVTITAGTNSALVNVASATTSAAFDSAAVAAAVQAASAPEKRPESFSVVLNQDSFFGFYPSFTGLIPVKENVDLAFYGILWTTDAFGTGLGSDLWTEFGIGANFHTAGGKLKIKPQIGITNGALLSRGNVNQVGPRATTLNGAMVFDGIVPSLTMNYSDDKIEAEYYGGYYAALRNRSANVGALDFLHTWVNAGYKFTSNFSAGAHFEILANTRVDLPRGAASNVYQWIGPYAQFSLSNGFFARFTGGWENGGGAAGNEGDFYKLAVGFSF